MENEQLSLFKLVQFNKQPDKSIPDKIHLSGKQQWCPYCSNKVIFVRDKKLGVKKCPVCNITERDYWVKRVNKIL
ncbi:MAG: hypothetical protein CVU93_01040 [Firmicutes bacterium HGW-Firmicutes-18]|nr:MAG: hypothetical protein CVU93_01040 [Firmicutes bacterium HGW-Firmicutes-18]